MNIHYTTIKKFFAGNKYAWPSFFFNAHYVFESTNKSNNLFDLLFCYEFNLDLNFLTDSSPGNYIAALRKNPMEFGYGDSVKHEVLALYKGDSDVDKIREQFNKHILSTWCFDKIKFSAGVAIIEDGDNRYDASYGPNINIGDLHYYILNEKYYYEMYLLLQNNKNIYLKNYKNIFLSHREQAISAFANLVDFRYDRNVEFETLFFPRLKLIWQLLDLPMEQLFYIREKKIINCYKISLIMSKVSCA